MHPKTCFCYSGLLVEMIHRRYKEYFIRSPLLLKYSSYGAVMRDGEGIIANRYQQTGRDEGRREGCKSEGKRIRYIGVGRACFIRVQRVAMVLAIIVTCVRGRISLRRTNAGDTVGTILLNGILHIGSFEVRVNAGTGRLDGDVNLCPCSCGSRAVVCNRAIGRNAGKKGKTVRILCVRDKFIPGKFARFRENNCSFLLSTVCGNRRVIGGDFGSILRECGAGFLKENVPFCFGFGGVGAHGHDGQKHHQCQENR